MEFLIVLCLVCVFLLAILCGFFIRAINSLENQLNQLVGYVDNLLKKSEEDRLKKEKER